MVFVCIKCGKKKLSKIATIVATTTTAIGLSFSILTAQASANAVVTL